MAKRNRGYTIVEMALVVIIIATVAAIAIPSMSAVQRGQSASSFRVGLENVIQTARQQAARQNRVTVVKFNSDNEFGWDFVEDQLESESESSANQDQDNIELGQVRDGISIPQSTEFVEFRRNKTTENQSDWQVMFMPDGTAERAVAEFTQDGKSYLLIVYPKSGASEVREGTMNDYEEDDSWDAGELEQRVG